jgi:soluble lytic murein transglycosylase-like protein
MHLLRIILLAGLSLILVVNYSDPAIASGSSKSSKASSHHRSHKAHGRKKAASKAGTGDVWERIRSGLRIPRPSPVSAGFDPIKISLVNNSSIISTQITKTNVSLHENASGAARMTTVITPKKMSQSESNTPEKLRMRQTLMPHKSAYPKSTSNPEERYTKLGRLKLGQKKSTNDSAASITSSNLFKSQSMQRVRTRLGLHPELFKHGGVTENLSSDKKNRQAKHNPINTLRNCADLNKQEVTKLSAQELLPDNITQLAELCRQKQNANYARVSKHINGYSAGYLNQIAEHARPYLYHITNELSKHNLPLDLALLPIVESAYKPTALSNKDAAGIWQFIPSTGREYGLQQNSDYDGRLDITASTHAAIRFLSGLNAHFRGDWLLSLAAYNSGQGTVDAAISRNQAEGLATDFWSLDLPTETEEYVPRLLALSSIFANPSSHGLKLRPVRNEPYFIKVHIDRENDIKHLAKKDLQTVAKLADFDPEQFGLLNTAYLKSTLPESNPFTLLMPIGNANLLHQSLAFLSNTPKSMDASETPFLPFLALTDKAAETRNQLPLLSIDPNESRQENLASAPSAKFEVSPKPMGGGIVTAQSSDEAYWAVHYLDKGESLKAIADAHGISEEVLRLANKFKRRQSVSLGDRLLIPIKEIAEASLNKNRRSVLFSRL